MLWIWTRRSFKHGTALDLSLHSYNCFGTRLFVIWLGWGLFCYTRLYGDMTWPWPICFTRCIFVIWLGHGLSVILVAFLWYDLAVARLLYSLHFAMTWPVGRLLYSLHFAMAMVVACCYITLAWVAFLWRPASVDIAWPLDGLRKYYGTALWWPAFVVIVWLLMACTLIIALAWRLMEWSLRLLFICWLGPSAIVYMLILFICCNMARLYSRAYWLVANELLCMLHLIKYNGYGLASI